MPIFVEGDAFEGDIIALGAEDAGVAVLGDDDSDGAGDGGDEVDSGLVACAAHGQAIPWEDLDLVGAADMFADVGERLGGDFRAEGDEAQQSGDDDGAVDAGEGGDHFGGELEVAFVEVSHIDEACAVLVGDLGVSGERGLDGAHFAEGVLEDGDFAAMAGGDLEDGFPQGAVFGDDEEGSAAFAIEDFAEDLGPDSQDGEGAWGGGIALGVVVEVDADFLEPGLERSGVGEGCEVVFGASAEFFFDGVTEADVAGGDDSEHEVAVGVV